MHICFQALIDHGTRVNEILADEFCQRNHPSAHANESDRNKAIQLGTSLGKYHFSSFFIYVDLYINMFALSKLVNKITSLLTFFPPQ